LRTAILADEIARSLRDASLHKRLWDRDRRAINKAVELLTEMRRGRDAIKNKKVEESVGASLAYGQAIEAVQAMPSHPTPFESFEKLFELLGSQLKDLQDERNFEVEYVREFFTAVRDVALRGSGRKFETVEVSGMD
jgi:hypothetical protein